MCSRWPLTLILCTLAAAQDKRPMTFRDVLDIRRIQETGGAAVSRDGKRLLYSLSVPDWKAGQRYSDLYLVSLDQGLASTRQLTFTRDRNETNPGWSPSGHFFAFRSDRDSPAGAAAARVNQLYTMSPDGGEARRLTDAKDGVSGFAFSSDGRWLAYSAGKEEERRLWLLDARNLESAPAVALTSDAAPAVAFQFSPDAKSIYFTALEPSPKENHTRVEKKFTARLRNEPRPLAHLWRIELDAEKKAPRRLTQGAEYSVADFNLSKDGRYAAFRGESPERYKRGILEAGDYSDLYQIDLAANRVQRITANQDSPETTPSFSPDSRWIAFTAPDDFIFHRNRRVYVRPAARLDAQFRKLGASFDGDLGIDFWSPDSSAIYFATGIGATRQLMSLSLETGSVAQVSNVRGVLRVTREEDSGALLIAYADPSHPSDLYTGSTVEAAANQSSWRRLTATNPQVNGMALGSIDTVQWQSSDRRTIEGVLTRPVRFEPGRKYPLIVSIHGGPASADVLQFPAGNTNYAHVLAGAGYMVLQPNYRGSTNYGERHKSETSGDYFRLGYDDIMTGVDFLIAQGLADANRMGVMGWSAGGHYSNWILTHTNRFKAISSGAGAANWLSMYAQSDMQRVREFYFGGVPYDRFDQLWDMSPLKYIKNASTPTLIHCVDGDPRVPRPQSDELHMALKKLGVTTEFLVYPGNTHGITDMRNQMVKMMAEFQWFEKHVRDRGKWFDWKDVLATLDDAAPSK